METALEPGSSQSVASGSAGPAGLPPVYALIGNPNAGKTTIFNALTGLRQKVGNYPGVTVEKKEGVCFTQHGHPIRLIDLPGAYSLAVRSPDEAIMLDVLLGRRPETPAPDGIICVIDASNLERNLYLATQALELGLPMIVVLNMMDAAEGRGLRINVKHISEQLGVPVIPANARRGEGIIQLRLAMSRPLSRKDSKEFRVPLPDKVEEAVDLLSRRIREYNASLLATGQTERLVHNPRSEALFQLTEQALESTVSPASFLPPDILEAGATLRQSLQEDSPGWQNHLPTKRYAWISKLCGESIQKVEENRVPLTERIDMILLHPVFGWFVLLAVMGTLFYSIFTLAAPVMDGIDWLVAGASDIVVRFMPPGDLRDLIVDGIFAGVGGIIIFLPQILILFFFIALLESTGYMARAAFILDRVMSKVGLHGRSFIPLLSSYACAVPGILATRTIESARDRLVTILVAPFMTCSARLPVYLLMIATLVPEEHMSFMQKAGLLLILYFLGTITVFIFAFIFKKTLLKSKVTGILMELPPYRVPALRYVFMEMLERARLFIMRAGSIILGLSIIIWFSMNFPKPPEGLEISPAEYSIAGRVAQTVEPVFAPLGYDWRITLGVLSSTAAREIFVSTMSIIYHVEDDSAADGDDGSLVSVLQKQRRPDGSKMFTPLTCISLMIFFVFAMQCMSTLAAVKRETNSWGWPVFQICFMSGLAYVSALLVYQGGLLLGFQ